jgi:hypothetical protein
MDRLIKNSLSAARRGGAGPCVSENLMAAYLEKSLTPEERSAVETHIADCAACQGVLALALKLQSENDSVPLQALSTGSKKRLFHLSIPIPALGALLLCIAIGALFFRWPHRPPEASREQQVAELRSPVQRTSQPTARVATNSEALEEARVGVPVNEMKAREVQPEHKSTAPTVAQSALPYRSDGLDAIEENSGAEILSKKKAESLGPGVVGTIASTPGNVPKELSAARAEVTTRSLTVPTSPGMAALPAVAAPGNGNNLPSKEAESAGSIVSDKILGLRSQSADTPFADHRKETTIPTTVASELKPKALPVGGAVGGAGKDLQANEAAGKSESSTSDQPKEAVVLARTQQPFVRPHLYAASNRIATSLYETENVESSLQFAIKNLGLNLKTAGSRKIGDRVFYKHLGFSIDGQCVKHAEDPVVSVTVNDPEYKAISEKYPEITSILPAAIYWESKNYLLK